MQNVLNCCSYHTNKTEQKEVIKCPWASPKLVQVPILCFQRPSFGRSFPRTNFLPPQVPPTLPATLLLNSVLLRLEVFLLGINTTNYEVLMLQVNYLRILYRNIMFHKNIGVLQPPPTCTFEITLNLPFKIPCKFSERDISWGGLSINHSGIIS